MILNILFTTFTNKVNYLEMILHHEGDYYLKKVDTAFALKVI